MKEHCVVSRVQFPSVLLYIIFSKQSDVHHYKSLYSLGTMLELEIVQGATPWCTNPTLSSVQDTLKNSYSVGQFFNPMQKIVQVHVLLIPSSSKVQTAIQFDGELASIDVPFIIPYICKARYKHEWVWLKSGSQWFNSILYLFSPPGDIHVQVQATSKTSTMKTNII